MENLKKQDLIEMCKHLEITDYEKLNKLPLLVYTRKQIVTKLETYKKDKLIYICDKCGIKSSISYSKSTLRDNILSHMQKALEEHEDVEETIEVRVLNPKKTTNVSTQVTPKKEEKSITMETLLTLISKLNLGESPVNKRKIVLNSEKKEKTSRKSIPASLRNEIWSIYVGNMKSAPCPICEKNMMDCMNGTTWHVGHIVPHVKGGNPTRENLRPICSQCNLSMSDMDMREYVSIYYPKSKMAKNFSSR